jgi:Membrane protein putatively involved in post-translational modification of the autoinducing quorum-sensing peptide
MEFIRKWSYSCAYHLAAATNENHQQRSVYYYGFYIVIGAIFKIAVLAVAAALTKTLLTTFTLFFAFGALRTFAGGVHMESFNKCMIVSFTLYITGGAAAEYTNIYWNTSALLILAAVTLAAGLYALPRYAPRDTPNKRITDISDIEKFKKLSLICLFVLIILIILLIVFGLKKYCIAACLGVLFELFTITSSGYKFFNRLSSTMGKKVNAHEM